LRHREGYDVQPAAIAQHQCERADVRQRFLLLGFLPLARWRCGIRFRRPVIAVVSAFAVSCFMPIAVAIVCDSSLLFIRLLALDLRRVLCLIPRCICRRGVVIPANSENINYPRVRNRRRIASAT